MFSFALVHRGQEFCATFTLTFNGTPRITIQSSTTPLGYSMMTFETHEDRPVINVSQNGVFILHLEVIPTDNAFTLVYDANGEMRCVIGLLSDLYYNKQWRHISGL
jgi:hypothetical protein